MRRGIINQRALDEARHRSQVSGTPLWKLFLDEATVPEVEVLKAVGEVLNLTFVDIQAGQIDPGAANLFKAGDVRKFFFMPVSKTEDTVVVAVNNPYDMASLDEIRNIVADGVSVEFAVATRKSILTAIEQTYETVSTTSVGSIVEMDQGVEVGGASSYRFNAAPQLGGEPGQAVSDADFPIIKLVNGLIAQAVQDKASDVHIEPEEDLVRVRFRIDGLLHEAFTLPKKFHSPLVSRIKILSKLDISEQRVSMDGRFQMKVGPKVVDLRVSTMPVMHGENIVLRLLDMAGLFDLVKLGIHAADMERLQKILDAPFGLVLFAGPTGSGKTTALYCCLNKLNSKQKHICTIEDPIEFKLPLVRQIQVNVKTGMSFAGGMRAVLRQDPDVIMVGEIRDKETAEVAIQAALTGHLVLSSIHTNDAAGTIVRFMEMQIEPYLIASGVGGVVALRLMRVLCMACREKFVPSSALVQEFGLKPTTPGGQVEIYKAKGCQECKFTGYRGRTGIFEILTLDEQLRELVAARASASAISREARRKGMLSLRDDGLRRVMSGMTTVEEVARVTRLMV
ncbi:MAG: type II/IV secretion system protein [Planctomycetes bacterium]|nr:type II/IV secretion system protein [Planctomycetota bacterium]